MVYSRLCLPRKVLTEETTASGTLTWIHPRGMFIAWILYEDLIHFEPKHGKFVLVSEKDRICKEVLVPFVESFQF